MCVRIYSVRVGMSVGKVLDIKERIQKKRKIKN